MEYKISHVNNKDHIFLYPKAENYLKLKKLRNDIAEIGAYLCRPLSKNKYNIDECWGLSFNDDNLKAIRKLGFLEAA